MENDPTTSTLIELTPDQKITLFKSLFRGRDDCYGEGKGLCTKESLTDGVIKNHLTGQIRIGVYLLTGEQKNEIYFSVMDFDKDDNEIDDLDRLGDVIEYIGICQSYDLNYSIEHSKSSGSYHVWHFFSAPVSALKVRRLMADIVSNTDIKRFETFPKQDKTETYGNYINLPLFKTDLPTNTAFLDENYIPYENQWQYLESITKNTPEEIDNIIAINEISLSGDNKPTNIKPENWVTEAMKGAGTGNRTDTLVRLISYWAKREIPNDKILAMAETWDKNNKPTLEETYGKDKIPGTVKDILTRYHNGGIEAGEVETPTSDKPIEFFKCTDYGNAERLVYYYGNSLRYCHQAKSWFIWDGKRWKQDTCAQIYRMAKETVRKIYIEAGNIEDEKIRKAVAQHARSSEANIRIQAMITLAQSELPVSVESHQLDANPWMFNCLNGTIDLKKGLLLPHSQKNLITKLAPVVYDPEATLELWNNFLDTVTKNEEELKAFLQRSTGYTLTGNISEEKLFIISGPAASGKSTFIEAIKSTLSEYSKTADFESFVTHSFSGGTRNDIAALAGARFVSSIEIEEGKKLAEGLVKLITGGDTVTARFLYHESFSFLPQFKLWLVANDKPEISPEDDGMWRRIIPINFDHVIPEIDRDPLVKTTLKNPEIAGSAILAWAVKGCLDWQANGLLIPDSIRKNRDLYKNEMNVVKQYINEHCILDSGGAVSKQMLYNQFQQWCKNTGIVCVSKNVFGKKVKSSFADIKEDMEGHDNTRTWIGIRIKISLANTISGNERDLLSESQ